MEIWNGINYTMGCVGLYFVMGFLGLVPKRGLDLYNLKSIYKDTRVFPFFFFFLI